MMMMVMMLLLLLVAGSPHHHRPTAAAAATVAASVLAVAVIVITATALLGVILLVERLLATRFAGEARQVLVAVRLALADGRLEDLPYRSLPRRTFRIAVTVVRALLAVSAANELISRFAGRRTRLRARGSHLWIDDDFDFLFFR